MTFAWPQLLVLLLVPAALAAWEAARRVRGAAAAHPKILRAEAGQRSLRLTGAGPGPAVRGRARWWLAAGLALAVVALARPQWGQIDEPVFDQSREVLLALDLSRSMLTPDVKPSRLERSKLLIQALLDRLDGERVGLVVFSGTAFLQSPLSADYEILREFLPSLKPDFMPEGGTNYGALLDTSAAAFGTSAADRFLIVLSDGGATDENWQAHLGQLKAKGIRVIGLGVGTSAGALIPDGAGGLVKDDRGAAVLSRLENESLRELADKTGGVYRDASEWVDLASLLRATVEAGKKGKFTEKNNVRHVERYQWALGPALLCLLLSFWREFPVRPRARDIPLGPEDGPAVAAVLLLFLVGSAGLTRLAAEPTADPASPTALAHIVSRLAGQDRRSAQDWAELAGETLSWGGRVQSAQQPVPEGPVHDALASVDAGSALDAHAADWPKLRAGLEGLLQKPPQSEKKDQQQQKQQQQNQPQNQQQQQQSQQNSEQSQSQQEQQQQQNQSPQSQNQQQTQQQKSAFGGMNQPPPPAPDQTQKVGGTGDRQQQEAAKSDPALAASLEKLDQIKGQDSPAELFQMIENNEPHPKNAHPGKDW